MSDDRPYGEQLADLLDKSQYDLWMQLCECIDGQYEMDRTWGSGGKAWDLEYKYRRGGKTLCALYAKEGCFGFMVILGKVRGGQGELFRGDTIGLRRCENLPRW